jgi:integrase
LPVVHAPGDDAAAIRKEVLAAHGSYGQHLRALCADCDEGIRINRGTIQGDEMLDEERRILEAAPLYLRVAIILLAQTGGRTYSEGFSLRWSQLDFEGRLIRLNNNVKTPGSAEPIPLSEYACEFCRHGKRKELRRASASFRARFSQTGRSRP